MYRVNCNVLVYDRIIHTCCVCENVPCCIYICKCVLCVQYMCHDRGNMLFRCGVVSYSELLVLCVCLGKKDDTVALKMTQVSLHTNTLYWSDEYLEEEPIKLRKYEKMDELPNHTLREFVDGRDMKDWSSCDLEVDTFHAELKRDQRSNMVR